MRATRGLARCVRPRANLCATGRGSGKGWAGAGARGRRSRVASVRPAATRGRARLRGTGGSVRARPAPRRRGAAARLGAARRAGSVFDSLNAVLRDAAVGRAARTSNDPRSRLSQVSRSRKPRKAKRCPRCCLFATSWRRWRVAGLRTDGGREGCGRTAGKKKHSEPSKLFPVKSAAGCA